MKNGTAEMASIGAIATINPQLFRFHSRSAPIMDPMMNARIKVINPIERVHIIFSASISLTDLGH